ncbi:MAG: hypothetical protein JW839_06840 [Candidatus Lokiarchaeota archaeon]|nr:hypothetical protein [Candidatus Lokiarchaeota archaeon]
MTENAKGRTGRGPSWVKHGTIAGPLFNISYILYVLVTDVALVGSYAWISLGMPLGLTAAFVGIFFVQIFNLNRRPVRFITMVYGIFYIIIVTILPLPMGGNMANSLHNIIRLVAMSPWYATWERSAVYGVLSYAGIACYALTVVCAIASESPLGRRAFDMALLRVKKEPGRAFAALFRTARARKVGNSLRFGKSLIVIITSIALSATFITGNQLWYATTYKLEYSSGMLNDLRLEYWLGVDEQFTNDSYPLLEPPGGYTEGSNASINISSAMALPNPLHAAQIYANYTYTNMSNLYAGMIPWSTRARLSQWTGNWSISPDNSTLRLVNISAGMADLLEAARTGSGNISLLLEGYTHSRLVALARMNGAIAMAHRPEWVIYGDANGEPVFNDYSAWDRIARLFFNYGIQIQSVFGLDPFLMKFDQYAPRLRGIQKARLTGPHYWRATLEGHMYNVERGGEERQAETEAYFWDHYGWNLTREYNEATYGIDEALGAKNTFFQETWARNTMDDETYAENAAKWRALFEEMHVTVLPNGTPDEAAYFKQINCGTMDSLVDIMDGDVDDALFNHYLGSDLPWDVAGYMFYRGNNQPYWTYGFTYILSMKPQNHPREERMVYLGCVGQGVYSADEYKEKCIRAKSSTMASFSRDLNGDGRVDGFDSLAFDIMMVRATGVKRINLWPGIGPRDPICCDYREFPRELTSGRVNNNDSHTFFTQMADLLSQDWQLEFDVVPGQEHFWDKHLTDIMMDFMRPKGLSVFAIFGILFTAIVLYQRFWERKKTALLALRQHAPV